MPRRDVGLPGIAGHGHHHGLGAAGLDKVEPRVPEDGVVGHETLLARRGILGSDMEWSEFSEIIEFEQVF
jgi:hypothetical protein